jgi:hypothetical protein
LIAKGTKRAKAAKFLGVRLELGGVIVDTMAVFRRDIRRLDEWSTSVRAPPQPAKLAALAALAPLAIKKSPEYSPRL